MLPAILCLLLAFEVCGLAAGSSSIDFNRDVRPILSDKCFTCHGPDAVAKKIPFRLDSEAAAKADLGNGRKAIVDHDAASSAVVQRITSEKPALRMPPVYSGLKLTDTEIRTIRDWIQQGAQWQKHWSFLPPVRKPLPDVADKKWARNPIDYFVLHQLEKNGLKPSPEASREKLLRRVSLDLTGLPPTLEEVDAFISDKSPKAYEKVVDRLLASPRYGERMAVRWLDAARYADSNGYQYDGERSMWRWRDWVIDSFNRNQPYDQFTVEQIAGDLLPNATTAQKIATGFNRNHRANTEDGIIDEEYAVEYVVDRVETTSTVFLGVTLGCARCHNHKYDPFTQKNFYQMFAYFNNVPERGRAMKYGNSPPLVPDPTADQQKKFDALTASIHAVRKQLLASVRKIEAEQKPWESALKSREPIHWAPLSSLVPVDIAKATLKGAPKLLPDQVGPAVSLDGSSYLDLGDTGVFDIEDKFTMSAWIYSDTTPDGSIVSRMSDNPKGKGYGIHADGGKVHFNFTSSYDDDSIRLETEKTLSPKQWHHIAVTYTGSRMAEGIAVYVDGKLAPVKVLLDRLYRPLGNAGKPFHQSLRIGAGWGPDRRFKGTVGGVRIYTRVLADDEIAAMAIRDSVNIIAAKPDAERTPAERNVVRWSFLENAARPQTRDSWKHLAELQREREALERTFPTVMVMAESPKPKDTFLLIRGAYDKHGERVTPGVPEVLHPLPASAPANRLGLAKWLVDPANPLTARVAVNRFWQTYFGAGLVKTIEDFGVQGDWPSNPDLLDWLATEFIRGGWNIKAMQKLIVTSATYRQQSQATPELLQRDPENRLLARGPRHRVSAEMVRDQALFAAGLLVEKLGGPSVKPYQPAGLWQDQAMQDMEYKQSTGPDLYRRSLYTFWKRTIPPPMMTNFDASGREACVVRETRTNTPLQALNLMNDVTFNEAARFIGKRMMKEGGSDPSSRLRYGFRLILSRAPSAEELKVLESSLNYHRDYFNSDLKKADALIKVGDSPADPSLSPQELASYASVASLMLNLDEAVNIQ
jgi:hypothetical protein